MKKTLVLILAFSIISTVVLADTLHLKINENRALNNGEMMFIDVANPQISPVIIDKRTLVPVRFIAENFGCDVAWDESTQTVMLSNPQSLISLKIGSNIMTVEQMGVLKEHEIDVPAQLIGGRTFLPLRAIAETALGKEVTWFEMSEIICIADTGETYFEDVEAQFKSPMFNLKNYPKIDCSTATIPFVNALNKKLLGIGDTAAESLTISSKTHGAYVNLIEGKTDIIFVAEPNEEELKLAEQAGISLEITPFCMEGFVFLTHKDNPINSLTIEQVQNIYQGKITNWSEVGGANEEIVAYQRNANSGSQTIMENLVMKGLDLAQPPSEEIVYGMGELINAVANYQNTSGAIGYSVYYYANEMIQNPQVKLLEINKILPSPQTIQSKQYPFLINYYAVTVKDRTSNEARELLKWILSDEGQQLVLDSGYVKK